MYCYRLGFKPLGGLCLLLFLASFSSEVHAVDLVQAYQMAERNDATFQAARAAFAAAIQQVPQARAGLLPTLSLIGGDSWSHGVTRFGSQPSVGRDITAWNWALKLDQPIFRVDSVYAYRESGFAAKQAKFQWEQAKAELILRVAKAYFDVLVAEESVSAARAQLVAMQQQLARAEHGFKAGLAAVTDVYEAKSRLELAHSQALLSVDELQDKRAELDRIIDGWPPTLAALGNKAVVPTPEPDNLDAWIQSAREGNLQVGEREAALSAAVDEISRMRAEYYPKADLTASYGTNYTSGNQTYPVDYSTNSKSWEVGVQVSIPLYSGGRTNSRVLEAIAKREEMRFKLESARRQAATEARKAYDGIEDGLAQTAALESSFQSASSAVKGNEVGYRLGIRINMDVLDAQEQLYDTERKLVKSRYDTLMQGLKLKEAAGSLSVEDLVMLNSLLTKKQAVEATSKEDDRAVDSKHTTF